MSINPAIRTVGECYSVASSDEEECNEMLGDEDENTWAYDIDPFEPSHCHLTDSDDKSEGSTYPGAHTTPAISSYQRQDHNLNVNLVNARCTCSKVGIIQ
jgi:hypothetical protein